MYSPVFTVPQLRWVSSDVHHDSAIGHPPLTLPDDDDSLRYLLRRWSGLLRCLTLAGYRTPHAFIEYQPRDATSGFVLDLATLGNGVSTDLEPDLLDPARATDPAMLIGLAIDPLWLFGEWGGAPMSLILATGDSPAAGAIAVNRLAAIDGVHVALDPLSLDPPARGWLGFTFGEEGVRKAGDAIDSLALAVVEVLTDAIRGAWSREPSPLGPPAGLGWIFDEANWWFPASEAGWPDADARLLRDALSIVAADLRPGVSDPDDPVLVTFLTDQLSRQRDPTFWTDRGSFGHELRTRSGADVVKTATDAYRRRVDALSSDGLLIGAEVSANLADRFTFTDALLAMVEHGAIGIGHRLLPGLPSTALGNQPAASIPEWTTPQLTGQWDAVLGTNTLILNQAGTAFAGFWQLRIQDRLERYVLEGSQTGGLRLGGPLSFSASCWHQPPYPVWGKIMELLGEPAATGELSVSQAPGEVPLLTLTADFGDGPKTHEFQLSDLGRAAHATEPSMAGLSGATRKRIRDLRDAPLHRAEYYVPLFLAEAAAGYVTRFLDEQPDYTALNAMMDEFRQAVDAEVGAFAAKDDLMATARVHVRTALTQRFARPGRTETCRDILGLMFRMTFRYAASIGLQEVYGMVVQVQSGAFQYQWRLVGVTMHGRAWVLAGAAGTGTLEIRRVLRVDAEGKPIDFGPVVSNTIDLTTGGFSVDLDDLAHLDELMPAEYEGPGEFADWNDFYPTNRDITGPGYLDEAYFTLSTGSLGFLGGEIPGGVDVELQPTDGLPPLMGLTLPTEIEVPLLGAFDQDATLADLYERLTDIKGVIDEAKEIPKQVWKEGKLPLPSIETTVTEGWIRRADNKPSRPDTDPVSIDEYRDATANFPRFDTREYDLTTEFRNVIRDVLLWNLPRLTRLGQLTVRGHASQLGREGYNLELSRDRAMSVLTAVYDILGPQLAVACGDVKIRGLGESEAAGPEPDAALDRRVEIVIGGFTQMRS